MQRISNDFLKLGFSLSTIFTNACMYSVLYIYYLTPRAYQLLVLHSSCNSFVNNQFKGNYKGYVFTSIDTTNFLNCIIFTELFRLKNYYIFN